MPPVGVFLAEEWIGRPQYLTYMSILRNDSGNPIYPIRNANFVSENAAFVVGASPVTLNVSGTLTPSSTPAVKNRNGMRGYLKNDGPGDLGFKWSNIGTNYLTQITIKAGESLDITGLDIDQAQVVWIANTGYRFLAL